MCLAVSAQSCDFKTFHRSFGEGVPILLINGGPGFNSEGFLPLAKELSKKNKVIIYDQRGSGRSYLKSLNNETITLNLMVSDIENLRIELQIKDWIVMGHSFGGMLSTYYASKHPDKVRGLILSSSGGMDLNILGSSSINERLTSQQQDSFSFWSQRVQSGDTSKYARYKRGLFLAPAYLQDKSYVPVVAERLTQGNMALNGLVWSNMRAINFDTKAAMADFQKPVLIVHGAFDVVPLEIAEESHELFPRSKLVILENSSHYGWLDQPTEYFGAIFHFLDQFV